MPQSEGCSNDSVGQGDYVVAPGDCVSSIAYAHGLFWETLWNHPDNAPVRQARTDPNALLAGDRLTIPERRVKEENCATEIKHRFQLRGVPAKLRLRFLDGDEPRANERYRLFIDDKPLFGSLDKDGKLEVDIPPDARDGRLFLGDDPTEHRIQLGAIDPIGTWRGVAGRLNNLGYDAGTGEEGLTEQLAAALAQFQEQQNLEPTGEPNDETRRQLKQAYGG